MLPWQQNYTPVSGSLGWSALVAAIPIFALLFAIAVKRLPAWKAALVGLGSAMLVALFVYRMPAVQMANSVLFGAAFGLFPIGWIIFWAIVLYRVTVETGKFEIIKNSVGSLTDDKRVQALLIAFAFGAFIEGASGFGTPVAVAAAMLTGLGFQPFYAARICLLANTAPVAFGAIGIPLVTLAGSAITGLPLSSLSADVGRICAPVSLFIPAYLVLVMGGWRALKGVLPAAMVCGVAFAGTQFTVSNFVRNGVYVTDILSSLAAMLCLVVLLRFWKPKDSEHHQHEEQLTRQTYTTRQILHAWSPYVLLVIFVSLWGFGPVKALLDKVTVPIFWPGLNKMIERAPKVGIEAKFTLNLLSAAGTACMFSAIAAAAVLKMSPAKFLKIVVSTAKQLVFALVTLASVLALAYLMNYCGATATLGLAFAATGRFFPFFSPLLGWLGVFLTGSDTSANALFGNLQVVTANTLGLNSTLMAAANSSGGVMGKMISLQSIAVAACATGMPREDESRLFRFTLKHSIFLATVIGLVVLFYAYAMPGWARK